MSKKNLAPRPTKASKTRSLYDVLSWGDQDLRKNVYDISDQLEVTVDYELWGGRNFDYLYIQEMLGSGKRQGYFDCSEDRSHWCIGPEADYLQERARRLKYSRERSGVAVPTVDAEQLPLEPPIISNAETEIDRLNRSVVELEDRLAHFMKKTQFNYSNQVATPAKKTPWFTLASVTVGTLIGAGVALIVVGL